MARENASPSLGKPEEPIYGFLCIGRYFAQRHHRLLASTDKGEVEPKVAETFHWG
jgi:hypothetical protein